MARHTLTQRGIIFLVVVGINAGKCVDIYIAVIIVAYIESIWQYLLSIYNIRFTYGNWISVKLRSSQSTTSVIIREMGFIPEPLNRTYQSSGVVNNCFQDSGNRKP